MESYLYKYRCPGTWWGSYEGLRNVYTNGQLNDAQAISMAKEDIKKSTGNSDCGVTLLVKYKLSIESVKTYPDITKIPFSDPSKRSKVINLGLD